MSSPAARQESTPGVREQACSSRSFSRRSFRFPSSAFPRRILLKGAIGLSLPAVLLSSAVPVAQRLHHAPDARATALALAGAGGAFVGDAGLSEADLVELGALDGIEGTLDFGAPRNRPQAVKVSADVANLRGGPGIAYEKLGKLKLGATVTLIERSSDWFRVETAAGKTGWMAREVLDVDPEAAAAVAVAKHVPASPNASEVAAKPVTRATTNDSGVNLRSGPGTKYAVVGKLGEGAALELLGGEGGWYKVRSAAGADGWVLASYLLLEVTAAPKKAAKAVAPEKQAAPARVATEAVGTTGEGRTNLRRGPGTDFAAMAKLAAGTRLTLVARHGDWFQVRTAKGTLGWVQGDLLELRKGVAAGVPAAKKVPAAPKLKAASTSVGVDRNIPGSSRGVQAARVALRYVGSRYVWGGASPRGFDCSGLVLYAYRQVGLRLPHKAASQFSTRYGARINSIGALKTGDIVFFRNTAGRGITHVSLYVGGGRMVTANSPRTGVQLQRINTRYWRSHFAGAIRPRG